MKAKQSDLLIFLTSKLKTPHVVTKRTKYHTFQYAGKEFVHHANLPAAQTAVYLLNFWQKLFLIVIGVSAIISFFVNWHMTLLIFISFTTVLYIIDLVFNLGIIYRSFTKDPEIQISQRKINQAKKRRWPTYTIMCPLYKEWKVVPQFIRAIESLDYPRKRIQVLFLMEKNDKETIQKVKNQNFPSNFKIIVIPESKPKTKPKALNYGLSYATGEYLVVYDAEDIPDPLQLKKAVLAFEQQPKNVVCVQAKLNFYNPHQNLLTRMFAAEYSLWFDLVLTGLQTIHAPIPLGGTSNHFRKKDIVSLGGWDSFNVTEDADLGMRLSKKGFKTIVVNSYTMEEANSDFKNWFRQRSRWIKGYIQTYIVHMRSPIDFIRDFRKPHAISFQIIIGGKVLSMLINPLMWITTFSYFTFREPLGSFIETFFPGPIFYMAVISLVVGNFLYTYYYMLGIARRKEWDLIPFSLLTPIYWLFMSAAAVFAFYEIIVRPHYWHKTKHGLHLPNLNVQRDDTDMENTGKKRFVFLPA